MKPRVTIIEACNDKALFAGWFKDRKTWAAWFVVLKALFGLPMNDADLVLFKQHTGRTASPSNGFREAWLCIGRRGGKSRILALIAVFLATFVNWASYLSPGEIGVIVIIATDRRQARVIFKYIRALLKVPMLAKMVEHATDEAIDLKNGLRIEIQTASFRSVRGHTVIAALCDEIAFWRTDETSANPDREILDALRPAMATIPGAMLLCASSPYARRGTLYDAIRKHHGNDGSSVLAWKADTRAMNATVPQRVIDEAYERDPASAAAEFGAEFRTDIESFVSREAVDAAIVPGRRELPPISGITYHAFVDPSGGSSDAMTLAIAHRDKDGRAILDAVRERRPPFSPEAVVAEFAELLKSYRCHKCVGDHWGGEFVRQPFRSHGITYELSEKPKSDIYRDTLAPINSGKVELLDLPRLTAQLCGLERRTARSGKDSIDHAPGAHDDIVNAVCGALVLAASGKAQLIVTSAVLARARMPMRTRAGNIPAYFR